MVFNIVVKEDDNNSWYAYVPALPGCISIAESKEKVLETVKEAIAGFLEAEQEQGLKDFTDGEMILITV